MVSNQNHAILKKIEWEGEGKNGPNYTRSFLFSQNISSDITWQKET